MAGLPRAALSAVDGTGPGVGQVRCAVLAGAGHERVREQHLGCSVVVEAHGQPIGPPAESFIEKVEWDRDIPVRWRPHADPGSPVRIDTELRFGKPAVRGISTEVIWEHVEADESFGELADQFDLTPDEARWAYAYETSARAA